MICASCHAYRNALVDTVYHTHVVCTLCGDVLATLETRLASPVPQILGYMDKLFKA